MQTIEQHERLEPELEELFLKVCSVFPTSHVGLKICPLLYSLHNGFPSPLVKPALRYLIKQNLVGVNFLMWYQDKCNSSPLQMHANLQRLLTTSNVHSIIFGKNFGV